jgi:hypothetical protein
MKTPVDRLTKRWFAVSRLAYVASCLVALVAFPTSAAAKTRGVGIYVEGPGAAQVRDALVAAVPKGLAAADAAELLRSLAAHGESPPFTKELQGKGQQASAQHIRDAASAMSLEAVLVARVSKVKTQLRVRLWVIDASPDAKGPEDVALGSEDPKSDAQLKSTAGEMLTPYAKEGPPPADDSSATTAKPEAPESAPGVTASATQDAPASPDAVSTRPHGLAARSLFDAAIGADVAGRHFAYNDGISPNLRTYSVLPATLISARVEFFPLADQKGFLRDIGLVGSYARSLYLESTADDGIKIHTVESAISGGLRFRIHPWGDTGTIIGISDAYTSQSVTFDSAGAPLDQQVPAVNYQANRTAVDVRVPFGPVAVLGDVGFRAVTDAGDVAQRFRTTTANGVDAEVGCAVKITGGLEARLLVDYERYFYSFRPQPGDTYVAGGALDQFYGATLALAYIF